MNVKKKCLFFNTNLLWPFQRKIIRKVSELRKVLLEFYAQRNHDLVYLEFFTRQATCRIFLIL